jgi:hypothetical protein
VDRHRRRPRPGALPAQAARRGIAAHSR